MERIKREKKKNFLEDKINIHIIINRNKWNNNGLIYMLLSKNFYTMT